ncbi:E3 binding domain-containing protein, partial [Streptomyces sp. IBSBF 2435]
MVRKLAAENGVNLGSVRGTGVGGRDLTYLAPHSYYHLTL